MKSRPIPPVISDFLGPTGTVCGCGSTLPGLTVSGIAEAETRGAGERAADRVLRRGRFAGTVTAFRAESTYLFYSHALGFGLTVGL